MEALLQPNLDGLTHLVVKNPSGYTLKSGGGLCTRSGMSSWGGDVVATKVYFPEDGFIQVHQSHTTRCPPEFQNGMAQSNPVLVLPSLDRWHYIIAIPIDGHRAHATDPCDNAGQEVSGDPFLTDGDVAIDRHENTISSDTGGTNGATPIVQSVVRDRPNPSQRYSLQGTGAIRIPKHYL